jgi:hypothetical protein
VNLKLEAGAARFVSCGFLDPEAVAAERVSDGGVKKLHKKGKPPRPHSGRAQSKSGTSLVTTWILVIEMKARISFLY